jgi:hypothetical protein
VLIFFHIPKTGGSTMDGILEHCFPAQCFNGAVGSTDSALLVRPTARIAEKFRRLPIEKRRAVRCVTGVHLALDVETIFDRTAKFFTILRHPAERVISSFFYNRTKSHLISYPFIKDMTLAQYLDSGIGLDADNHQVRMLSGCPELDAPWDPNGRPISAPPVEPHHLDMAKRNIEERFIVAAPLEQFSALVWFFKRLYGWPLHRLLFNRRNENAGHKEGADEGRPRLQQVPAAIRQRLLEWNQFDVALYEWVCSRFAEQLRSMEPEFSQEVRRFERLNGMAQQVYRAVPHQLGRLASRLIFTQ